MPESVSATYRGFRNQALYVLYRLLTDEAAATQIYRPEGAEDLAVYQAGGTLVEAVQVKDYSSGLSLSSFKPDSPKGFFARFHARRREHPACTTKLVSFGALGPELQGAIDGTGDHLASVVSKLCRENSSITSGDASTMFEALRGNVIRPVSANLLEAVIEKLRASAVAGNLDVTVSLLMSWVFEASESARDLTKNGLLEQLARIASYLAALRDNSAHWGSTIQLIEEKSLTDTERERLIAQYRQGIQARWEHILAGADCVRLGRLQEISDKIKHQPVVIVRGASGQGKSSLGWRYLRDYWSDGVRFHVRLVDSREHALQVANALGDHIRKLRLQAIVYLDVAPADAGWTELVRELAISGIKVLITIREEDFRRSNIALGDFAYTEVVLEGITKAEAEPIFEALSQSANSQSVDFEEAWSQFGSSEEGPLLEFTYLAFQGESLNSRIASQVRRIRRDAAIGANGLTLGHVELLSLASVAAETGASVQFDSLCAAVGISPLLDPLHPLADEFLIQKSTDGATTRVTGLHSIRSRAVVKALFSDFPEGWGDEAIRVLPLIVEQDLSAFLLHAFSRHTETADRLIHQLSLLPIWSWTHAAAITGALLWEGISRYEKTNHEAISRGIGLVSQAWWMVCDSHVGMPNGAGVNTLELMRSMIGPEVPSIQLTPKAEVYHLFREWMETARPPAAQSNDHIDWSAAGDVAFWAGLVGAQGPLRIALENMLPPGLPNDLAVEKLGSFIEGRAQLGGPQFQNWCSQHSTEFRRRFVKETNSIHLDDDGSTVKVFFTTTSTGGETGWSGVNAWNKQAMRRIKLAHLMCPNRQTYSSQGIGLEIFEQITGHDPTTKEIPFNSLPSERSVRLNSQFISLVAYRHSRSETWSDYIDAVLAFRKELSDCFRKLHRGWERLLSENVPRQQSFNSLPGHELDRLKALAKLPLFPRVCVDEWGLLSEHAATEEKDTLTMQEASLQRFNPWKKAFNDYATGAEQMAMNVVPLTRLFAEEHRGRVATDKETSDNWRALLNLASAWEALPAMQNHFRARFEKLLSVEAIFELERNERSNFTHLWPIAFAMVYSRRHRQSNLGQRLESDLARRRARFVRSLETEISRVLGARGTVKVLEGTRLVNRTPHLCIVCDYSSRCSMEDCAREIPAAIWRASQDGGWQSLEWKPLEIEWPNVAVVSVIRGKATSPACARISTGIFFGTPSGFETRPSQYTRLSMDKDEFLGLGLELWDSPLLRAAQGLIAGIGGFAVTNLSFFKLAEIIHQYGLGGEDQSRILRPFGYELGKVLTVAQQSYAQLLEVLAVSNNSQKEAWARRLEAPCQALLMELEIDRTVSLNLESFTQWAGSATEANRSMTAVVSEILDFVVGSVTENPITVSRSSG
jgi:hypothetical protein